MDVVQTWEMYKYWSIYTFFTQDLHNLRPGLTHFFHLENLWILDDAWCANIDRRECFKEKAVVHRFKPLQISRKFDCGVAICKMLRYGSLPNCSVSGWTIYQKVEYPGELLGNHLASLLCLNKYPTAKGSAIFTMLAKLTQAVEANLVYHVLWWLYIYLLHM